MKILIKNGRVIDPISNRDVINDVLIEGNKIVAIEKDIATAADKVIDACNYWVIPGLVDIHVHLREPGFNHKETIKTGSESAAKGGFTTICCMPNTNPVIDNKSTVEYIHQKTKAEGLVKVLPIGAITKGQLGKELADIEGMKEGDICGISEDGKTVMDSHLMKKALELAKELNLIVFSHCEAHDLVKGGVMNEGKRAEKLGLRGISSASEEVIVARDIDLAIETKAKLHLCHLSTEGSVELLRNAKKKHNNITAEVCPHHFILTEDVVTLDNTNTKMNPPLRSHKDVEEIKRGLKDGTIDIIATDHAPHHIDEKNTSYEKAPFGIVGLETAVALTITELVNTGILTPLEMVEKMSTNPAKLLGIAGGELAVGKPADITIIDPDEVYKIDINTFVSKGRNSPFHGKKVRGKVKYTIVEGKIILEDEKINEVL